MCTDGALLDRDVRIRPADCADFDQLRALDVEVFERLAYPHFVLRQLFDVHRGCWLVADHPSGVVGYSLGVPTWNHALGWLLGLAIAPGHRRLGYGRRLTLGSLEILRSMGVTEARLTVEPANLAAIQLYRQIGFSVRGLRVDYLGAGEDRIIMVRPLAELPEVPRQRFMQKERRQPS